MLRDVTEDLRDRAEEKYDGKAKEAFHESSVCEIGKFTIKPPRLITDSILKVINFYEIDNVRDIEENYWILSRLVGDDDIIQDSISIEELKEALKARIKRNLADKLTRLTNKGYRDKKRTIKKEKNIYYMFTKTKNPKEDRINLNYVIMQGVYLNNIGIIKRDSFEAGVLDVDDKNGESATGIFPYKDLGYPEYDEKHGRKMEMIFSNPEGTLYDLAFHVKDIPPELIVEALGRRAYHHMEEYNEDVRKSDDLLAKLAGRYSILISDIRKNKGGPREDSEVPFDYDFKGSPLLGKFLQPV